jgi:hypothetical protein
MVEKDCPPSLNDAVEFLWSLPTQKAHDCAIRPTRPGVIRRRTFEKIAGNQGAGAKWLVTLRHRR